MADSKSDCDSDYESDNDSDSDSDKVWYNKCIFAKFNQKKIWSFNHIWKQQELS